MAAPMAVSSCKTFVDALSRGSTWQSLKHLKIQLNNKKSRAVFEFFITGRGRAPSNFL